MTAHSDFCSPGIHLLTQPIRVSSGERLNGAGARLIGGVRLTDFRIGPDGVYECDLAARGIVPQPMHSRGFNRESCRQSHSELFINGRPCNISQYPERGSFLKISGYAEEQIDEWGNRSGKLESGFFFADDRPAQWAPNPDLWAHGYWSWDWANSYEHVAALDAGRGFVRCDPPYGQYKYNIGQRFYFLNIREEVRHPGDYCIDYAHGKVFFLPFEDGRTDEVLLSTADFPAFLIENAEDVRIEGFELEAFCADAVCCTDSRNVTFRDLHIHNCGTAGMTVLRSRGVHVEHCRLHDLGDGGVRMIDCGDRATLTPADCGLSDCQLYDLAKWSRCYCAPVIAYGVGLYVRGCVIHDCPHIAVLYQGNDISITGNEIYRAVLETGDAGAIYSGRDFTCRGNVVSDNFIHHLGGVGYGTMGIYNDDCLSGTVMERNVFYKVQRAIFLGGGRDFIVRGNVFVDCSPALEADARGACYQRVWRRMIVRLLKESFYHIAGGASADRPPYSTRYPELADIDRIYRTQAEPMVPPGALIEDNVICCKRGLEFVDYSTVGEFVLRNNRTVTPDELPDAIPPEIYRRIRLSDGVCAEDA